MDCGCALFQRSATLDVPAGPPPRVGATESCKPVLRSGKSCGSAVLRYTSHHSTFTLQERHRPEPIDPDASRSIFLNDAIAACGL
jgi:hypothetical protein